jgi:type II secretory pathway pseudopilin PulG
MSRGFTLLEVVIALLLIEVAVVAAVGTLTMASRVLGEAERIERAVAAAEGTLDSLGGVAYPESGTRTFDGGTLQWSMETERVVGVRADDVDGSTWFEVHAILSER